MKNINFRLIITFTFIFTFLFFIKDSQNKSLQFSLDTKTINPIISLIDFDVYEFSENDQSDKISNVDITISDDKNFEIIDYFQKLQETITYIKLLEATEKEANQHFDKLNFNFDKSLVKKIINSNDFNLETVVFIISELLENGIYQSDIDSNSQKTIKNSLSRAISNLEAKQQIINGISNKKNKLLIKEILENIEISNIIINSLNLSSESQKKLIRSFNQGDIIIAKNKIIDEKDLMILNIYNDKLDSTSYFRYNSNLPKLLGFMILSFLTSLLLYFVLTKFFNKHDYSNKIMFIFYSLIALLYLLIIILVDISELSVIFVPCAFFVFYLSNLARNSLNFVLTAFLQFFLYLFYPEGFLVFTITSLSALTTVFFWYKKSTKFEVLPYIFLCFLISGAGIIGISLFHYDSLSLIFFNLIYLLFTCSFSVFFSTSLSQMTLRAIGLTSREELLNLLDYDNPLLKKLAEKAPGTYHHSLVVGNISESIASAIQANPLLARVGSYYHDIGKIEDTHLFIENSSASPQFHDLLHPKESAKSIRGHIERGLELANQYKLPKSIIDIIQQHHGDSKIRYFLAKAEELGLDIDINDYQYTGPKPQTKEAALVMIADIVESTTKSMNYYTTESIAKVIDRTIENLLYEKQLVDSKLTLKDLEIIRVKMTPLIKGIYRRRLEYPDAKH